MTATANHPLLTLDGWRELRESRRARESRSRDGSHATIATRTMPDHEVVLLAALIADGNLTQRTPRFCFG